jgi:hypothetical protein
LPTGWSQWKFWQTSSTATVNGISGGTDVDEFNGTLGDLRTFAGGTATDSGSPVGPADASTAHDAGVSSAAGLPPPGTGSPMGGVGMAASDGGASNNGGAAMGQAGNGVPAPDASAKPCGP